MDPQYLHPVSMNGLDFNKYGGIYTNGRCYAKEKKMEVALAYQKAKYKAHGGRPNLRKLARECKVSRCFVTKIEQELVNNNGRINEARRKQNKDLPTGPGARTIDRVNAYVLLYLYLEEPSRSNQSYADHLLYHTGEIVSKSTISRFFNYAFPIRGGFCRPNLVPIDKFKPDNLQAAKEYLEFMASINPKRLKFGDEKLLKGSEIYCRKARRNVLTGQIPAAVTPSDFRNTYAIIGFCGIDEKVDPVRYRIHDQKNDALHFAKEVEAAISVGWLHSGNILVLDNAAIHHGKENTVLEKWLWESFAILLIFLPTRTPEWNPVEQVWKLLVQRLKRVPLTLVRQVRHSTAIAAAKVLDNITHDDVACMYRHSRYLA